MLSAEARGAATCFSTAGAFAFLAAAVALTRNAIANRGETAPNRAAASTAA